MAEATSGGGNGEVTPAANPAPRTGRVSRTTPLFGMAARTGIGRVGVLLRPGTGESRRARREQFHEEAAQRYAAVLGDMKGALMKAGQILSFVDTAGLVPDEYQTSYQRALEMLQSDAPPMDFETVRVVVEHELEAPLEHAFERFSPVPIAAASIGQVHAARLDGREVAVKVQYPGIADAIEADLANADMLAGLFKVGARALPGFSTKVDARAVVEEVSERIVEELDYRTEAANQQEFADLYRDHPFVRIPEVFPERCTARVLTMELVDGSRFKAALDAPPELRNRWGRIISRFVFASLYRHGLFNADPHPGNYLFHEDGTVTFLDFGCVKRFDQPFRDALMGIDRAIVTEDPEALCGALHHLGIVEDPDDVDPQRLYDWYSPTFAPITAPQPFTYTREFAAETVRRHFDPFGEWKDVVQRLNVPKEIVFLNRILVGLNSVLGMLEATADWRAASEDVWGTGPPAGDLGRAEAEWRERRTLR